MPDGINEPVRLIGIDAPENGSVLDQEATGYMEGLVLGKNVRMVADTYPSTVAVMGGKFMLPVSAENRSVAGVTAGDVVDVELELDTGPRELTVPPDFEHALELDAAAKATFDRLSRSVKQWHVLSIEGAKTAETRERRIAKSVGTLHEGKPS